MDNILNKTNRWKLQMGKKSSKQTFSDIVRSIKEANVSPYQKPSLPVALKCSGLFLLAISPLLFLSGHPVFECAAQIWVLNAAYAVTPILTCKARLLVKVPLMFLVGGIVMILTAFSYMHNGYKGAELSDVWLVVDFVIITIIAMACFWGIWGRKKR